jgi:hypothetical protein
MPADDEHLSVCVICTRRKRTAVQREKHNAVAGITARTDGE